MVRQGLDRSASLSAAAPAGSVRGALPLASTLRYLVVGSEIPSSWQRQTQVIKQLPYGVVVLRKRRRS
jgi:hypothetical protein